MILFEEAENWNLYLATGLFCLWLLWAFIVYDDVRAYMERRVDKGVVNCPFCRGMHKPGECRRDQKGD